MSLYPYASYVNYQKDMAAIDTFVQSYKNYPTVTCLKVASKGMGELYVPKCYDFLGDINQTYSRIHYLAHLTIQKIESHELGADAAEALAKKISIIAEAYQSNPKLKDQYSLTIKTLLEHKKEAEQGVIYLPIGKKISNSKCQATVTTGVEFLTNLVMHPYSISAKEEEYSQLNDKRKVRFLASITAGQSRVELRMLNTVWGEYMKCLKAQGYQFHTYTDFLEFSPWNSEIAQFAFEKYEQEPVKHRLIHFPLGIDAHYMGILMDLKEGSIEFYDAQAYHPAERLFTKQYSVKDLIEDLKKMFFKARTVQVKYLIESHQQDRHLCVFYVNDFIERRLSGETFEQIAASGKNFSEITQFRSKVAQQIYQLYIKQQPIKDLDISDFVELFPTEVNEPNVKPFPVEVNEPNLEEEFELEFGSKSASRF